MKYYVGVNAEATADELWKAVGDISGGAGQEITIEEQRQIAVSRYVVSSRDRT